MMKKVRTYYIYILALTETALLTAVYYYFWRIGYTHGIPGYPEYLGVGKFVLMAVYALMTGLIMYFAGGFRYRRVRPGNIIIRQWGIILVVNLITYLQLSLTAKHMVARRPIFDATVIQFILIFIYALLTDLVTRRIHVAGRMIVFADDDSIENGYLIDGYKVAEVRKGDRGMTSLTALFELTAQYDAVLVGRQDETTKYIIRHCLDKKIPIYIGRDEPLIQGVSRMKDDARNYVLILGMGDGGNRFFDRIRSYLV